MSFKNIVIVFVLSGLFALGVISFGIGIANNNNTNASIGNDPRIQKFNASIQGNLSDVSTTSQSQRANFEQESPLDTGGEFLFASIIGAGKTLTSGIFGFANTVFTLLFSVVFGGDKAFAVVIGTIFTILLVTVILFAWRLYKTGE